MPNLNHPAPLGLPGLAAARCARGMSRAAVAQALGLHEADIYGLEAGTCDVPPLVGLAIAELLRTPLAHLQHPAPAGSEPRRAEAVAEVDDGQGVRWLGIFPAPVESGSPQRTLEQFYQRY